MPESQDREFIREKIVDKAVGKRHRIWKFVRMMGAAVIFGLVASLFFVLGKNYLEPYFAPEETTASEAINIGRDEVENPDQDPEASLEDMTSGEDVLVGEGQSENTSGESNSSQPSESDGEGENTGEEPSTEDPQVVLEEKIREAASQAALEELKLQEEYLALGWYRQVSEVLKQVNKGLVTITGVTRDTDWFNNPVSSADQSAGAIIYMTEPEILILADYEEIRDAEALTVTFAAGNPVEARIKKADSITGIAIVSVSKVAVPVNVLNSLQALVLGNSYLVTAGSPVLAAGCPAGHSGSVTAGMIALVQKNTLGTDTAFQLLYPDVRIAENGGGFLFDSNGNLIGMLTDHYGDEETGLKASIGISSLKGIIEKLSSGIDAAYLGIQGQNATDSIAQTYHMPTGIYVTKVVADSPAYLAGVQAGDVIVACGAAEILTTQKLQSFLESYSTGDVITLKVYRSGQDEYVEMEFEVTLGAR